MLFRVAVTTYNSTPIKFVVWLNSWTSDALSTVLYAQYNTAAVARVSFAVPDACFARGQGVPVLRPKGPRYPQETVDYRSIV